MKQTVAISSPTCFGYCVSIIRELHCAWLNLRMSLYVKIVQIVQRQGLAVIFHVVWFSLQEPVVCELVAGLRVYACDGYAVSETCWRRNDNGLLHVLISF
jgi:hypothetical protein